MTQINQTTFATFLAAFKAARIHDKRIADATSLPYELRATADAYLSEDGLSGFLVGQTGELTALFSRVRGRGDVLVQTAIHRGAIYLDAFDGYLPKLYARHGFVETHRVPNWAHGGPAVVHMVHIIAMYTSHNAGVHLQS